MQAENTSPAKGTHQLRHAPAVDNFRSQRLKRGDSERMAQYVYQEADYNNATTNGGGLGGGEGYNMRDETSSAQNVSSAMSSNDGNARTIGVASVISGITAEGEAMRHGGASFGVESSYIPAQQMKQVPREQYPQHQQSQQHQYAQPQPYQHSSQQSHGTHRHEPSSNSQAKFSDDDSEPISPVATGYQQPFFSRPVKGVDTR